MTAQELRELRKTHGLTQRALGELLGYGANYIARLEREGSKEHLPITQRFEKLIRAILKQKKVQKVCSPY